MAALDDAQFTVDTALFRQLGELLVGRDSTALIELVKNSYDADATTVVLGGFNLATPDVGSIRISDDGTGMTAEQFKKGFLRLAARGKAAGERRTSIYQRHFTGEKGVGRLAAHKLGSLIEITSTARSRGEEPAAVVLRRMYPDASSQEIRDMVAKDNGTVVDALIDWNLIEESESLSSVEQGLTVEVEELRVRDRLGTEIRISNLRHAWDSRDLQELSRQLRNFSPPSSLTSPLPRAVLDSPLLFGEARVRDAHRSDPGLRVELEGEFASPEEYWTQVERSADWVLEIRAERGQDISYAVSPTRTGSADNRFANGLTVRAPHPSPDVGPFFDARILLRSGSVPLNERAWSQTNSGIRVYLEGFRVLPYGEIGNDWLALDQDYTRRSGRIDINPLAGGPEDSIADLQALTARDVTLRLQPNRNFYGAVFLTDADSGGLRTLVNREGFVPDDAYNRLVGILRNGTNLLHRAWALASLSLKRERAAELRRKREAALAALASSTTHPDSGGDPSPPQDSGEEPTRDEARGDAGQPAMDSSLDNNESGAGVDEENLDLETRIESDQTPQGSASLLRGALSEFEKELDRYIANPSPSSAATERLRLTIARVEDSANRLIEDASLLRVLASVGSHLSIATHELSNLTPLAMSAEAALAPQPGERWPRQAAAARDAVVELRRAIERQSSFLTDASTNEARRRRTRLDLRAIAGVVLLTFASTAAKREVALANEVSGDVRTPPLFRSELQAILSNLVSNALKASPPGGTVAVFAEDGSDFLSIRVENTGTPVDLDTSEQWFAPYASTSVVSDPVLGQGMGLGLPITRDFVAEYGGTLKFVHARPGFDSALEVRLPR